MEEGEGKPRKKKKEVFVYGNYRNYYSYRIDRSLVEDPRLAVLKKEWFEGKDCLDIGCNQGLITISIAKKFGCRSILGMDIDGGLIETAKWNLRKIARIEAANSRPRKDSELEVTNSGNSLEDKAFEPPHLAERNLLNRVRFQKENFVESLDACSEKYDTVLCLSITKWIHLNWGDEGLITLFVKIWRLLRPGGLLILEPQPWSSYKRNRQVSEILLGGDLVSYIKERRTMLQLREWGVDQVMGQHHQNEALGPWQERLKLPGLDCPMYSRNTKEIEENFMKGKAAKVNFNNILFHPHLFGEILLDKVGFRSVESVAEDLSSSVTGFNRSIVAFWK